MGRLLCHVRCLRAGIAVAVVGSLIAVPTIAHAGPKSAPAQCSRGGDHDGDNGRDDDDGRHTQSLNCPGREMLVRVDQATCPATPNRPLIVRQRACCKNPAGRVHCDHFEHCPSHSPS